MVWLADAGNLIRCSPEQLRYQSQRELEKQRQEGLEFQSNTGRFPQTGQVDMNFPVRSEGQGPPVYVDNIEASGIPQARGAGREEGDRPTTPEPEGEEPPTMREGQEEDRIQVGNNTPEGEASQIPVPDLNEVDEELFVQGGEEEF